MLDGLNQCLKALLKQVAWPPPLASNPSSTPRPSKRPRAQMESENRLETADAMDSSLSEADGAAAGVQDGASNWEGFNAAGPVVSTCIDAGCLGHVVPPGQHNTMHGLSFLLMPTLANLVGSVIRGGKIQSV